MKVKLLLFALLFAVCMSGWGKVTDPPTIADLIELIGCLDAGTGPNAIDAYVDQSNVYVYFHHNIGMVGVSIENEYRVRVYANEVNTNNETLLIIPITGFTSGTYTLELSNAYGSSWGEFEIEP